MSDQSVLDQLTLEFVLGTLFLFFFLLISSASHILYFYFTITSYSLSGLLDQEFLQQHLCVTVVLSVFESKAVIPK